MKHSVAVKFLALFLCKKIKSTIYCLFNLIRCNVLELKHG